MSDHYHHHRRKRTFWNRRDFLFQSGGGIAGLALAHTLDQQGLLAAAQSGGCDEPVPGNPFAPKPSHFEPRAKAVISLFMSGGVSQVDTFDPKPRASSETRGEFDTISPNTPVSRWPSLLSCGRASRVR